MYLSRIELTDAISEQSQLGLLLRDRSYGIHRLLWDLFSNNERFLFREENAQEQMARSRALPIYYVVSNTEPKSASPIFTVTTKAYAPILKAGDQLLFRLRANPTVAKKQGPDKKSQRHDVVMNAQRTWLHHACGERNLDMAGEKKALRQRLLNHADFAGKSGEEKLSAYLEDAIQSAAVAWLAERGEKHGYELQSVQATGYRWNALPEKGRDAGFSSMNYEGVLKVIEPEKFVDMLGAGLGPSKAFGCGLMLIRRN